VAGPPGDNSGNPPGARAKPSRRDIGEVQASEQMGWLHASEKNLQLFRGCACLVS